MMKKIIKGTLLLAIMLTSVTASGQFHGWTVNASDYSYDCDVTAIVVLGGTELTTGTLGVFVGTECRGFVDGLFFPVTGKTIFTVRCYSNSATGELLTFKYYDPAGPTYYDISETVTFVADAQIGNAASPLTFNIIANDPPVVSSPIDDQVQNEGFTSWTIDLSTVFSDPDGPSLIYSALSSNTAVATVSVSGSVLTVTEAGLGNTTITATADDGEYSVDDQFLFSVNNVNDPPILASIGNRSVCHYATLTFTATATDPDLPANTLTYSLSGAPTGATINPSSGLFTWTPGATITPGDFVFTVIVTDNGSPSLSDQEQITVTVNPLPAQPGTITGPAAPCPNTSGLTYEVPEVTGASSYTWTVPAGWNISGGQGSRAITVTSGTVGGTVSVYASNACGNSTTRTLTVSVGTPSVAPTGVTITNNNTCNGTDKVLTVSGGSLGTGAVWQWFTGSCGGTAAGTGTSITVDPAAGTSTTYYVRASGTCNTTACASGTVVVTPDVGTPTTPTPSASTICQGTLSSAFTTSATNATGYVWSVTGAGNTVSGTGTTGTVTWSPSFSGVATVSVYATGCNGPSAIASTTVTVRPTPTATVSGTASVCHNAPSPSIIFSNPQSLPITVTYDINSGIEANINVNANSTAPLTIPTSTVGIFTYNLVSVNYQTAPSCPNTSVSGSAIVTVNQLPVVNAGNDVSIANGTSTTLTGLVTGTGPFTYSWTPSSLVNNPTSLTTTTVNLALTQTFTLTATSSAGCAASDQITVTVTGGALGATASATPSTICAGASVQLAANATGGSGNYNYSWTSNPAGFTSGSATPTVNPTVTTIYTVVVNDGFNSVSSNVTVTVNPLPSVNAGTDQNIPFGTSTTLNATVTGTGLSYSWEPASSLVNPLIVDPTTVNLTSTTVFTLTATTSAGCSASDQVTVTVSGTALGSSASATPSTVCAGTSVQLAANATGGSGTYSYSWTSSPGTFTSPSANPMVNPTVTTTYTVVVNDGFNTTSSDVTVTVNPLPTVNVGTDQTIPFGTSTTLNATVTGTGLTYSWVPAASLVNPLIEDPTTVNLNTTTAFTLTATTSAGCSASDQVTVNVTGSALASAATATPPTVCAGESVQLAANATGGSGTYDYSWTSSPGTFTSAIANPTVTPAVTTTYTVVVDDGFNSVSSNVTVTVNAVPSQPTITADGSLIFCAGEDVVLSAPLSDSYLWSNGATTRSITVLASGSFTVQVANAAGCQSVPSPTVVVNVNPLPSRPTINPAGSVTICSGSSQTLTSSAGISYLWSTGDITPNISVSTSGSYTVQVTNTYGCLSPASLPTTVTVSPPPTTPTITPSGTVAICAGESITLTSSPSTSYLWSNGATTSSISVSTAGNYSVRVTDANGCTSAPSASTTVTVNPLPSPPTIGTITQPSCAVQTGSVVLGGLPAGSWTINPGGITGSTSTVTVTGLTAGSHNFTVTNSNGCTSDESVAVNINTPPAVPTAPVVGTVTQPTCALSTGSIGFSGLPSTGVWTLTRNPGGAEVTGSGGSYTLLEVLSGTWTFTVTNDDGCISPATAPVTISAPLPIPPAPVVSVDCSSGAGNAVVTVTTPTGTGYQYRLDGGTYQTSNIFTSVSNGDHTVTVRNASGCTTSGPLFSVNCGCANPPTVTLSAISGSTCGITAVTVSGNTFGGGATRVAITENGGGTVTPTSSTTSPFTFTYTPVAGDAGRTVVVTVTTDNLAGSPCTAASATYTLTVNANPPAPIPGAVTQPSCALPTGSVILNNLPSSGEWTITVSPGGTTYTGTGSSTSVEGLVPGTYSFTVTNALGCVSASSSNVVINIQPDTPAAPIIGTITQPTCGTSTGSVALSGLPATGTWTVTRTPGNVSVTGSGTTRTIGSLNPGTYTFTVTNAAGCISPASGEVVINPQPVTPPAPVVGTITHPTCEVSTGSVVLEGLPETGEWILTRFPGSTTSTGSGSSATISSLAPGTYNFSVTNAEGCTSPVSGNVIINVQPPTPNPPVIGTITHPTFTVGTGSVVLTGLPSSGTWTLTRYPDGFTSEGTGTTRTVSGLEPGTYTFTVTNAVGCTSAASADVVINARPGAPIVVINNPPNICENQTTDLTLPAVTAGSDANLTFTYWTDAAATIPYGTPETAPAGTYYIMGTSTAGYWTIREVVVTADVIPTANAGPDQVLDYIFGTSLNADISEIGIGMWALVTGDGEIFNSTVPSTPVNGLAIGENVFSWTVTNGACDPVTDYVTVIVNNLIIPTLITPNQDGRNDFFVLRGLETLGRTELMIFDRRGLKVYENSDYDNSWEGLDYNSNPLPEDTYFYVVRAANGISRSGYIVVRR